MIKGNSNQIESHWYGGPTVFVAGFITETPLKNKQGSMTLNI
jgi:hypothetical protein